MQPTGGIEPPTFRLQSECSTTKLSRRACCQKRNAWPGNRTRIYCLEGNNANHYTSHASLIGRREAAHSHGKRGCILRGSNSRGLCPLGLKSSALTTRPKMHTVAKRGHTAYQPVPAHHNHQAPPARSASTPGNYGVGGSHGPKPTPCYHWHHQEQATTNKKNCSQSETRTHNLPVNSRARYRLRHPGLCIQAAGKSMIAGANRHHHALALRAKKHDTACGDRTRDQSIKSRTLYLTELRRPAIEERSISTLFLSVLQAWVIGLVV